MRAKRTPAASGATRAGATRPSAPLSAFAEDLSLLIRFRRMRTVRGLIRVLS